MDWEIFFLKKFLRDVFIEHKTNKVSPIMIDGFDLKDLEVKREWKKIDVLLVFKEKFVVAIENKIDAVDSFEQLRKYITVVNEEFKHVNDRVFVYLTPFGNKPIDNDAGSIYINYSYSSIVDTIEQILQIYRNSLNKKVFSYFEDYCDILRREIMENHALNKLADEVYKNHRDAIDFIINNKTDKVSKITPYFEKK